MTWTSHPTNQPIHARYRHTADGGGNLRFQ